MLKLVVPNRGLWLAFGAVLLAIGAICLPDPFGFYGTSAAVVAGSIGVALRMWDHYQGVQRFKRERDDFNRMLEKPGKSPQAG